MSDKKCKPIEWFECPERMGELDGFTERFSIWITI